MSDILDALRRAERERRLGQTPTVESLAYHATPPRTPRKLRGAWLLAAGTLVITATALAVLFVPRHETRPAEPAAAVSEVAPVVPPQPAPVRPAPRAEIPAIEDSEMISSLEDLDATEAEDESAEAADGAPPPLRSIQLNPEDIAATPAAEPALAPVEPPPANPPAAIPLRDMPAAYRSQFPAITLDIHVYDADPARRWIMVNGQRYRESDTLPAGPRLAQITADGAVFDYHGAEVLLPLQ